MHSGRGHAPLWYSTPTRNTLAWMTPSTRIAESILVIRGRKVLLDADLAALYHVPTKALVQAVKRNVDRFPADFMFRLTSAEAAYLRSQIVTSKSRGGRRSLPHAFTEQCVAMLSSVLRSARAIRVNIAIMRTFRAVMGSHVDLARKLEDLERRYDAQFKQVFDAIRALMIPPTLRSRRVGFRPGERAHAESRGRCHTDITASAVRRRVPRA
jgi:hypothetical protein